MCTGAPNGQVAVQYAATYHTSLVSKEADLGTVASTRCASMVRSDSFFCCRFRLACSACKEIPKVLASYNASAYDSGYICSRSVNLKC